MGEKQVNALETLILKELKSKDTKPKETKPIEYNNHFLNGLAKIRESIEPVNNYDFIYNFKC